MNLKTVHRVYFIGIGGIGMSALARYFNMLGKEVGGYDRTASDITQNLQDEGLQISYKDTVEAIPKQFIDSENKDTSLVIYTPAIPSKSEQLNYFIREGFELYKRSMVLGEISRDIRTIAVGGSHGKSTISAMVAEVLRIIKPSGSAFLGGISKNIESNLLFNTDAELAVMEADEFDRSFLFLHPDILLVSSMDPDHLDIYGDQDHLRRSFEDFLNRLPEGGIAIIKEGLESILPKERKLKIKYYGLENARDYYAVNITRDGIYYQFDVQTPEGIIEGFKTSVPGWINIENAVAAVALCLEVGIAEKDILTGVSGFSGIQRRFDVKILNDDIVYIDDYAHHPEEIKSFLISIRKMFPGKKITGIFQPHLFTRTRDFAAQFGEQLSNLDSLILLDIYPAREEPIPGVTSKLILDAVNLAKKGLMGSDELYKELEKGGIEVLVTMGAGDIDRLVKPIENLLIKNAS